MFAVTLIEQRFGDEYRFLGARLLDNGDLLIEGQDIGATAEAIFGEREYEYQVTIAAEYVPTILLWLLKERFDAQEFTSDIDVRAWLKAHDIPCQFMSF